MATINSPKLAKQYQCELCHYICCKFSDYTKHLLTLKHQKREKMPKNAEKYYCEICDYTCFNNNEYNKHLFTGKHQSATTISQKIAEKYYCETCHFKCSKESNWNKHLLTLKHQTRQKMPKNAEKCHSMYVCDYCNKEYEDRSGLWRHKKNCSVNQVNHIIQTNLLPTTSTVSNVIQSSNEIDKELLIKLLLKNQDVMEKMIEIMPNIGNQSHNTNSHNTQNFNIQMFLNEHCKNAMNLTDFIDSLPITAATYDSTIQNGLTKTLTNMITNGLSQLDILERPIHCTDATRKTLYVKEANNWEKDTELLRILLGIRNLARKQRTMISEWKDVNEGWETDDNIQTKLTTLICHSMTDIENDQKETSKIIRAISKNVYLDNEAKQQYIN
jgi:hypothetical protein